MIDLHLLVVNFFGLLDQHGQQHGLHRQRAGGQADGGAVKTGRGKQLIKNLLVSDPQAAAERLQGLALDIDLYGYGWQRAAH